MKPIAGTVVIDEQGLDLADFERVVTHQSPVQVSQACHKAVSDCRAFLDRVLDDGRIVYGVNTGFGKLASVILPEEQTRALQVNLIRSHACGVGAPYSEDVVRGMMLLRLVSLTRGYSGVRPVVVEMLMACLNEGIHPVIPQQGSLGASGDLAPLAHLSLVLLGEGEAILGGKRIPGAEALQQAGIEPLTLQAKEGLALINGTQAMTAVGLIAYLKAKRVMDAANAAAALTMEALHATLHPFAEGIQRVRPFPEQAAIARDIRRYLAGSHLVREPGRDKVQDAYALRCIPQVHGASLRALRHVQETLEIEMNAVTDNPLLFPDENAVYSGGNFHGQPIALAMDYLKIAVAELANIAERRTERLVNPQLNEGLPAFLAPDAGQSSGLMILQYVSASLVSENKVLAHPASVDSIPSSGNQEDHVSMGTTSARQANQIVDHAATVLAIELICAAQAVVFRGVEHASLISRRVIEWVHRYVAPYAGDRSYSRDIAQLADAICRGELSDVLAKGK